MAVRFDSVNDPYTTSTNLPGATYTVSFWFYQSVDRNDWSMVWGVDNGASTAYTLVGTAADGAILRIFDSIGNDPNLGSVITTMTVGQWYKIAIVSSSNVIQVYWGTPGSALTALSPITSGAKTNTKMYLGTDAPSEWWNGRITAFKHWDAALTLAEVDRELDQYTPVRGVNLIRWQPMTTAAEVVDLSGKGNNLTVGSAATTTEDGPPIRWSRPRHNITAGLVPVIVNAGIDDNTDQYEAVIRTATETGNTSSITARSWTVVSGPNQVGATLGTSASLVWAPTVAGTYVIRYSATNAAGTSTDDATITVFALNFPVTANLILGGSSAGVKHVSGALSANIVLVSTILALKKASSTRTFNIKLAASVLGQRINVVNALLKLQAAAINVGRPGAGSVNANLLLHAAATSPHRTNNNVSRSANIRLFGARTVVPHKSGAAASLPIKLTGALTFRRKAIAKPVTFNIKLAASIANRSHATTAASTANIVLAASVSNRFHFTATVPVAANVVLLATPVTHSLRFNTPVLADITLHAQAFTQRIINEVSTVVLPRADNTTQYDLVCVARIPQPNGPPHLIEVDPIDWTQINFVEELNSAPTLTISAKLSTLTDPIVQRANNIDELPTELWLFRNSKQVFAGPLLGGDVNGESIEFRALGLESYLNGMYVTSDLTFAKVDQFKIVAKLIDQWQVLDYGNFGILTAGLADSGVLRTITYKYAEGHNVGARINDLTKMESGFDMSIDAASRKLELSYPSVGVDRSAGEDAVVFDAVNVTSTNITFSAVPGDLASEAFGAGTGTGDEVLTSIASNLELRARYGRVGVFGTFDQVPDQASLDSYTRAMVNARSNILWIPGPNARVTVDSDISQYDVGDKVSYQLDSRLSVPTSFRIRKRAISVNATGMESVSLEFV